MCASLFYSCTGRGKQSQRRLENSFLIFSLIWFLGSLGSLLMGFKLSSKYSLDKESSYFSVFPFKSKEKSLSTQ